ncbi:MAG TPA: acetate kinase [Beutenbergiaceae bacterium]|nr:acetate kinase [Beutenbergiaceae bacterium]
MTAPAAGVVLVINSGSSSLKYQVIDTGSGAALAGGLIERIGQETGILSHTVSGHQHRHDAPVPDYTAAIEAMHSAFSTHGPELAKLHLVAVGHRVVQGGARFGGSVLVTEEVKDTIEDLSDLAPLHNPPNLQGIRAAQEVFTDLPHVAVFDTAFHLDMPAHAKTYAIDRKAAERHRILRYGAHGTSHQYVARTAAQFLGIEPEAANLIVLHLGNGASATAVRQGRSVDTSMGLTPLEGLVMGTRTGDIDPAVVFHLARTAGMDTDQIDVLLNRKSGLLGLSGYTDMRDVEAAAEAGEADADLALDIYCYRLRKYLGAYTAVLGRVDAVVFTAGIGENSTEVRRRTMTALQSLGIELDSARNEASDSEARRISTDDSAVAVLVVPTNEELEIAQQALATVAGSAEGGA